MKLVLSSFFWESKNNFKKLLSLKSCSSMRNLLILFILVGSMMLTPFFFIFSNIKTFILDMYNTEIPYSHELCIISLVKSPQFIIIISYTNSSFDQPISLIVLSSNLQIVAGLRASEQLPYNAIQQASYYQAT